MTTALEQFNVAKAEYERVIKELGKKVVNDLLTDFRTAHPEVTAIRWEQYTPYFNDGDACVFGIGEVRIKTAESDDEGGDYDDGFLAHYDLMTKSSADVRWNDTETPLSQALRDIARAFSNAKELLEVTFGDHAQVTIEGNVVTIDEYDHD